MDGAVFSYDGDGLLRIGGEIDIATAPELKAALENCAGDAITVDCTALTFMDSSGTRASCRRTGVMGYASLGLRRCRATETRRGRLL